MKLARLFVALSLMALLFTGCGSQTSNDNTKEVAQQTQESSSSSRPSHDAKYQPLPKDFDQSKYNITGYLNLEVKKAKRQVDNGVYVPKKRIDFTSVEGMIADSTWTIQRIIASDYCIEIRTIRNLDSRKFTWFLYDNGSWYGMKQEVITLGNFDVTELSLSNYIHQKKVQTG